MADIINWDNKFGLIKGGKKVIEGVGKEAEIVTNQFGGKQSKSPMAMHLLAPDFLNDWFNRPYLSNIVIMNITKFMKTGNKSFLIEAIESLQSLISGQYSNKNEALITISKVLQYGAEKYRPNNWRLISQEDHINHALIHYLAWLMGDGQDDHLEHCMCRLMMAYSTDKSPDFKYDKYVPEECEKVQG